MILKKILENQNLRLGIELFFLFLLGFLAFQGRLQLWLLLLVFGIFMALFWGRLFCGWLCPMNTFFRAINWVYKKTSLERLEGPRFFKKGWIRWLAFIVLLTVMMVSRQSGREINLIIYIFSFSVFLTIVFKETFWHRYLCPFSAPLSLTGSKSKNKLEIKEDVCTQCGLCQKICPSQAISLEFEKEPKIHSGECLMCLNCKKICPVKAIDWN